MPRRYSADFSRRFVISLWAHAPASLRHGGWVRWRKEHRAMTLTRARSNLAGSSGIRTRAAGTRLCSDAVTLILVSRADMKATCCRTRTS